MLIALAQMDLIWEDISSNINKLEQFTKEAALKNVEFILFPEMCLSGFTNNINSLNKSEEEIIKIVNNIAISNKINIGFGFAVKVDDKGKNKYIIISKSGKVLVNYTKIHPFTFASEDKKYYKGNYIDTCTINEFRITPFICYDLRFPDIFQIASKESQIIIIGANWPKEREEHWITLLKARAIENRCYILGVNRVGVGNGLEYGGASVFVSPNGEIMNDINSNEGIIIKNIELNKIDEIKKQFDIRNDRREELYCKLGKEDYGMPFIGSKVTVKISKENKEIIKRRLGEAIELVPGKSERFLMLGFEEEYSLFFSGEELEKGAFIEVKIFGKASKESYDKLTAAICLIYEEELGIPQNKIYVKYEEIENWGWNGNNF